LFGIPFPGFPKLLLSATHLVTLWLFKIPYSGYISPEAMVALLSVLSSLRKLALEFKSAQSHPDRESRSLPPPKCSILPVLDELRFEGVTEYSEQLVTRIDSPQLYDMHIFLFSQTDFDCPRLIQFINRTPRFSTACDEAHVEFFNIAARVTLRYRTSDSETGSVYLPIEILCEESNRQFSFIEQVCNSSLRPLSMATSSINIGD
jgi:hypothetical protein